MNCNFWNYITFDWYGNWYDTLYKQCTLMPCTECNYNFKFLFFFIQNYTTLTSRKFKKNFVSCSCRNAKIIFYYNILIFIINVFLAHFWIWVNDPSLLYNRCFFLGNSTLLLLRGSLFIREMLVYGSYINKFYVWHVFCY